MCGTDEEIFMSHFFCFFFFSYPSSPKTMQGVNIMMFCKEYNARTADQAGMIIPVEITVFEVSG